jgi:hypothetical protein
MKRVWQLCLGLGFAWAAGCSTTNPAGSPETPDASARDAPEATDSVKAKLPEVSDAPRLACTEGAQQSCASPENPLLGACHAGVRVCIGGVWGPCSEQLPATEESCNGIDDNCNGMTDEGCALGCLVVCANCARSAADGAVADGSLDRPFPTLEAAIAAINKGGKGGGTRSRICVAGGNSCEDAWVFESAGPLLLNDNLSVQGSYAVTSTGLSYCKSPARPTTTLAFTSNEGVIFDRRVVTGAELSGFVVSVTAAAARELPSSSVAITVLGAQNVSLSRIFVSDVMVGATTYGVSITDGGQAIVTGSSITGGQGRASAIGVYVNGGTVNLRNNCDTLVHGNCTSRCSDCGPQFSIQGHVGGTLEAAPARSSSVFITGKAGSSVVGNMICGGFSSTTSGDSPALVATVRCEGSGCSTVSGNQIIGGTAQDTVGLALVGADPQVDSNWVEGGCGSQSTTGVWLEGSSARLQNNRILGGQCLGADAPFFYGLHVKASGTSDSPDVHSNSIEPLGLSDCESAGVLLERSLGLSKGVSGTFRNNIISAGTCSVRTAIREAAGAALQTLANNDLYDPTPEGSLGTSVLYHHDADATSVAQVNAQPGASGNLSLNPKYVSYPVDFHLTAESACIDQGTADGAPGMDAEKNQRPAGSAHDIGAYEFLN